MTTLPSCAGVVLAGGMSARMGVEKAALPIGDETLLARIVRRLKVALPEVVVIGPRRLQSLVPDVAVFPDETPGLGPLGGLSTALARTARPRAFVMACDMPFVAPVLVAAMAHFAERHTNVDVVGLRTAARGLEPLHAIYARACAPIVRARIDEDGDRSLAALLRALNVKEFPASRRARYDPAGRSTFNANSPDAWRHVLAICAEEE
jgi:molybdopterin-guanine dinucleotide biosynthesis protein A